jgi:hypothetical protein
MPSKKMEEVLKYCKRSSLDKERVACFWPKNRPKIKDLSLYDIRDIDKFNEMANEEYKFHPKWFNDFKNIKSCFSLFYLIDTHNLGDDILEVLQKPIDEVPLCINECEPRVNLFVRWRLEIGK